MPETEIVRPLDSAEIKDAIAQTIAEAIRESLNKTCWLYGNAWPKFKADWRVNMTLENFGEERETFVQGVLHDQEITEDHPGGAPARTPIREGKLMTVEGEMPYTPPNVVRKKHGMPVPTVVKRDDGSTKQEAVVFRQTRSKRYVPSDPGDV